MGWVRACPAKGLPRCTSRILTRAYHHCSSKKCVRVKRPPARRSLRPELWEGIPPRPAPQGGAASLGFPLVGCCLPAKA